MEVCWRRPQEIKRKVESNRWRVEGGRWREICLAADLFDTIYFMLEVIICKL
jgi:hypothetical protein